MTTKISISQITAPAANVVQSLAVQANGTIIGTSTTQSQIVGGDAHPFLLSLL
jgi:hypothetical protein